MADDAPPPKNVLLLPTRVDPFQSNVVVHLKDLLARAEAGEFVGFVAAMERTNGETMYLNTGTPCYATTIGRLALLQFQLQLQALGIKTRG